MKTDETKIDTENIIEVIGVVGGFALAALIYFYRGWVFCVLWNWFVFPAYGPAMTVAHAVGIILLAGLIVSRYTKPKCGETIKWGVALLDPILTLGIGWIVHVTAGT